MLTRHAQSMLGMCEKLEHCGEGEIGKKDNYS